MNNRVNYGLVGFIVIIGISLMVGFVYWLVKPTSKIAVATYSIYFNESVLGLNIDAPVKYSGLSVGKVSSIKINPKMKDQVEVLISIESKTPIKDNTIAKLTAQGITGLSYINLTISDKPLKPLQESDSIYPAIHSAPSFLNNLENSFDEVSTGITSTLDKTNQLLNDENQKEVAKILKDSAILVARLNRLLDDKTIDNFHSTMHNLNATTTKFDALTPDIGTFIDKSVKWEDKIAFSFDSIMTSYLGIRSSMDEIKRAISSGEFNVKAISAEIMPNLNNTLEEIQAMMIKVDFTLDQHNRSPSDIIFKDEEIKKGPGER